MMMELDTILCGDSLNVLKALPEGSVHCCVTSPPYYGLRDYGCLLYPSPSPRAS